MKSNLHPVVRASIIFGGYLVLSALFSSLSPWIVVLIVLTTMQLSEEVAEHAKKMLNIRKNCANEFVSYLLKNQLHRLLIDALTLLIWFALSLWLISFISPLFSM